MRFTLALAILFCFHVVAFSQDEAVMATFKKFDAVKPSADTLGFYSLDWVCSLKEAKERAKAENRPVMILLNTNITAHCNIFSGHT